MGYYLSVLKKYAVFSGRARRAEYWYFYLFNTLATLALYFIGVAIVNKANVLGFLYILAVFIPNLAVSVRRLHDVGKSAWMLLIVFIPIVGPIWFLVLMAIDSNPEENKYGPNPKGVIAV